MTTATEFSARAEPFRPELLAHCYRILGSVHDAQDVVQETYLRAWRGIDRFEERSSLRRWLYSIATRASLSAVGTRGRRPLPSGLAAPQDDHRVAVAAGDPTVPWLQPVPDALLGGDPATIVAGRAGVRLAFVAALQVLPARQRAVLALRDVLGFSTAETAEVLGATVDAVDSALRRARARLAGAALDPETLDEPDDEARRDLLDRYVDAFARADPEALVAVLRADVELEMPPTPTWFTGRDAVVGFLAGRVLRRAGTWRMTETRANGQVALVVHRADDDGAVVPYGVQVLTVAGGRVGRITAFNDPALVPLFADAAPQGSRRR
ncbi:RNA polymerase subunit sigma-70 [Actinomycetospora sp. TBRC 11914]|uniref:RNA polymerase subunit sigma-70 n=1 Tax=Actinomycetospora sp. TBRC 11914 TaxID=2729387 RepID=UPI00145E46AE|nr:RNA polymerase subunit sigma-70 [Actinomycetospora sp. TBRC 11914]NMO92220.1 RNA polymerase subunit sigma-70 [Actinomycetospora sp. TBRC 11914]